MRSLRLRLVLIPSLILALGLVAAIGGELSWAPGRVQTEVTSGMRLGRLLVLAAVANARAASGPTTVLQRLATELPQVRHVIFRIVATPEGVASVELPHPEAARTDVPRWFARLFDLDPEIRLFPVVVGGTEAGQVLMLSNPLNEIAEIWKEVVWLCGLLAATSVAIVGLILWTVHAALRPMQALRDGFDRLERGDYSVRLPPIRVAELARIGAQFNSLARALGRVTDDNHRLVGALIGLQEAERKQLAHELHDETGPVLFGIRAEAASVLGYCRRGETRLERIAARAEAIGELVDGIQRTNARILARLRPLTLDQLGLAEALRELVAGWQELCPDIAFNVQAETLEIRDEMAELALYRVVQECLTNAARHAGARRVVVRLESLAGTDPAVRVVVRDDGRGLPPGLRFGFGLLGMSERVRALHGELRIGNAAAGGTEIAVTMPRAVTVPA